MTSDGLIAEAPRILDDAAAGDLRRDWGFVCLGLATVHLDAAVAAIRRVDPEQPPGCWPILGSAALGLARMMGDAGDSLLADLWPALTSHQQRWHTTGDPGSLPEVPGPAVSFSALLIQSDRDLATAASRLGFNPRPFEAWALQSADDLTGSLLGTVAPIEAAGALYCAAADRPHAAQIALEIEGDLDTGHETPATPGTLIAHWTAVHGLERYGFADVADRLRSDTRRVAEGLRSDPVLAAAVLMELTGPA